MSKFAGAFLLVVALVVAGCGQGGESGEGGGGTSILKPKSPAVGTWTVDAEALKAGARENVPPEMREMLWPEIEKQFDGMTFEVVLAEDGTFVASGNMGGDAFEAKGTWKLEGDQLSITTTFENGVAKESPDVKVATLADDKIKIMEEDSSFEMVLIRKD